MKTTHYKNLVIGGPSWKALLLTLPRLEYQAGMARGFLRDLANSNRVAGRLIYTRLATTTSLHPHTLDPVTAIHDELAAIRFELDLQKGLVSVDGSRAGLNVLWEALDAIPDVNLEFEDLNLNLVQLMLELQGAYKKNVIKSLQIRDYLARENMLANASFKVLEPQDGEKIAEKFSDQLKSATLTLKLPDGACAVTVARNGTVRVSDDAPDELLMFIRDLLPRFHDAEVETAEVVSP